MLFPTLFITIACGAVSGFHSLVSSETSSKQVKNEKDMLSIGFGAMLIETLLGVVALVVAGMQQRWSDARRYSICNFASNVAGF